MSKKIWEFKQLASNPDSVDLYVYGDIESDSYDWWWDETVESETSANHFKNELEKYSEVKEINLYVNSYGGSVYEAMSIRNQLKRHNAKVIGIVDGFAASAASFILTGCDIVKMYSNTMQMVHNMWMPACGNASQLSYQYGLCDEIIDDNVDLEVAKQMMQKVNKTFEQQVKYNKALMKMLKEDSKAKEQNKGATPKQKTNADKLKIIIKKNMKPRKKNGNQT